MSINNLNWKKIIENNNFTKPENTNLSVISILDNNKIDNIIKYTSSLQINEWTYYNIKTIKYFFEKYPKFTEKEFKDLFFTWYYNRNILRQNKNIIDLFDFENIQPWTDLIEIFINKIKISNKEFNDNIYKIIPEIISIEWPENWNISHDIFYQKLSNILKKSKINYWLNIKLENEIKNNTNWFWWFDDSYLNLCILKLLKTEIDNNKLNKIENIFSNINKKIFIWWSTENIPLDIKDLWYENINFSRNANNKWEIEIQENKVINSMWYLNAAYFSTKVHWAFVAEDHNIMEPLHALKLTVNNFPRNRFNHNWLASYLWEKYWLMLIIDKNNTDKLNQEKIKQFFNISDEELDKKKKKFNEIIDSDIINFVFWILFNFFSNRFKK